jgi:hypothetical protein
MTGSRDLWCRPILKTQGGEGFGANLSKELIRDIVAEGILKSIESVRIQVEGK